MTGWGAGMTGSKESAAFNGYSGAMNVAPTPCCSNLFCQRACAKSLLHPLNRHFRSFLRFSRGHTTDQIAGRVRGEGRSYALIHVVGAFLSTLSRPLRAQRISRMAGLEHSPAIPITIYRTLQRRYLHSFEVLFDHMSRPAPSSH